MAKKKRSRRRSTNRMQAAKSSTRLDQPPWSALEQAFFASAPPDNPEPPPEVPSFEDLMPAAPRPRVMPRVIRFLAALLGREAGEPELAS
jgi:hypothetical protein